LVGELAARQGRSPILVEGKWAADGGVRYAAESVLELALDADLIIDSAGGILGTIAAGVLATTGALFPRFVKGNPRSFMRFKTRVKSYSVRHFS
jgi:hypothetical protein